MEILAGDNSLSSGLIIHDTRSGFYNGERIPHEWIFINLLLGKHLGEYDTPLKFVAFLEQYFPKYLWHIVNYSDMQQMVSLECSRFGFVFEKKYKYKFDVSQEELTCAMEFGEIVTRFCIQYLNYSLIGCGGSKSIITAQDQCAKKFDEFLKNGGVLVT